MIKVQQLDDIEGIDQEAIELLDAAGIDNLKSLAECTSAQLAAELATANQMLMISEETPDYQTVKGWIDEAREKVHMPVSNPVARLEEAVPEVERPPIVQAIPVPPKSLVKQQISVANVPIMEAFVDLAAPALAPPPTKHAVPTPVPIPQPELVPEPEPEPELVPEPEQLTQLAPVVEYETPQSAVTTLKRKEEEKTFQPRENPNIEPLQHTAADVRKSPSEGLNKGKQSHSRSYIRGVLHPQPFRLRFAALISIFVLILFPLSFFACLMILLKQPLWWGFVLFGFFFFGILYLIYARGLKCRVCGQPLFAPKACHRHVKAHHIPVIGYILPTSVQMLIFHWFRCMYCGTSIRLKE